ncbi:hypothetical protein CEK29_19145 [Bordetella genomosp. 5]|uniref:Uncharacterized protein n=1 Tax=Bordetella genomosp. 5 TaxID=1395608 RepID=A0A261TK26_9BORD|nr:hypothetical protein [Bordetella genomosp. 5]OZI39666.1 hypothetical protein CEK29_19145 [Bordetella genomosp. 5]OZI48993.1 hypothetical protein CAL25_15330 [Bordetella genomosp. 5]
MKFTAATLALLSASATYVGAVHASTAQPAAGGAPASATVNDVFNGSMLGVDQRYFESVAGIARESFGKDHVFVVKNCRITATIDNGKVSALSLVTANGCDADLRSFIGEDAPTPGQPITPRAFGSGMRYTASCLAGCGNAVDPAAYALWQAPRSSGGMEVLLEMLLVGGKASSAAHGWREHMNKSAGEDYVLQTKFNCETRFDTYAAKLFADVPVTAVTIGYGLPQQKCR